MFRRDGMDWRSACVLVPTHVCYVSFVSSHHHHAWRFLSTYHPVPNVHLPSNSTTLTPPAAAVVSYPTHMMTRCHPIISLRQEGSFLCTFKRIMSTIISLLSSSVSPQKRPITDGEPPISSTGGGFFFFYRAGRWVGVHLSPMMIHLMPLHGSTANILAQHVTYSPSRPVAVHGTFQRRCTCVVLHPILAPALLSPPPHPSIYAW